MRFMVVLEMFSCLITAPSRFFYYLILINSHRIPFAVVEFWNDSWFVESEHGRTDGRTNRGCATRLILSSKIFFTLKESSIRQGAPKKTIKYRVFIKTIVFFSKNLRWAAIGRLEIGQLLISCENELASYMQDGLQRIDKKNTMFNERPV